MTARRKGQKRTNDSGETAVRRGGVSIWEHLADIASAPDLVSASASTCLAAVALGFDHAALALVSEDGAEAQVVAEHPAVGMLGRVLALAEVEALQDVVAHNRALAIPDLVTSCLPVVDAWLEGSGARSLVWVPIVSGAGTLGWLSLHLHAPGASEESASKAVRVVTLQLGAAADQLRARDEPASWEAVVETLRRASASLMEIAMRSGREGSILDTVAQDAVRTVGGVAGGVFRYSPATGEPMLAASHPAAQDVSAAQWAAEILAGRNTSAPPYLLLPAEPDTVPPFPPLLCVPLRWPHRVVGVLYVQGANGTEFTRGDADLLVEDAERAALALVHRSPEGEGEEPPYERRGMDAHQASVLILRDLGVKPLDERLHDMAETAANVLGADGCQVLIAASDEYLELRATFPRNGGEAAVGDRFRIGDEPNGGLTGWIAHTKCTFRAHGQELLNHPSVRRTPDGEPVSRRCFSLLAIPLLEPHVAGEPQLIGLLRLENKQHGPGTANTGFSAKDQETGETVAVAVAKAIFDEDVFRSFLAEKEANDHQRVALSEIARLHDLPLFQMNPEAILNEAAQGAMRITTYACAVVYAVDAELGQVTVVTTHGVPTQEGRIWETLGQGFAGQVAREGVMKIKHGAASVAEDGVMIGGVEFEAAVGVPLLSITGSVDRVLVVADRGEADRPSQAVLDALQTYVEAVVPIIRDSQLWTWDERSFRRTESLRLIAAFMERTVDEVKLLGAMLTGLTAGFALGYNRAAIYLLDAVGREFEGRYAIGSVSAAAAHESWEAINRNPIRVDQVLGVVERGDMGRSELDERVRGVRFAASALPQEWVAAALKDGFTTLPATTVREQAPREIAAAFEPESPVLFIPIIHASQLVGFVLVDNAYLPIPVEAMATRAAKLVATGWNALSAREQGEMEVHSIDADLDDVREVYAAILKHAREDIFGASHAALWTYDRDANQFSFRGHAGPALPAELESREPHEGSVLRETLKAGWIAVGNIEVDVPSFVSADTCELLRDVGVQSFQAVVLRFADHSLAVLGIGYPRPLRFLRERDRLLALRFGQRAALVLGQAQLRARIRRVRGAARVLASGGTSPDPTNLPQAMAESTRAALGCHFVVLFEYEHFTGELRSPPIVAAEEGSRKKIAAALAATSDSWVDQELSRTGTRTVEDATRLRDRHRTPLDTYAGAQAYIVAPLHAGSVPVGLLCVGHTHPYRYTREEQDDVTLFGSQIALFLRSQHMNRELIAKSAVKGIGIVEADWRHEGANLAATFEDRAKSALNLLDYGAENGSIRRTFAPQLRVHLEDIAQLGARLRNPPVNSQPSRDITEDIPINEFLTQLRNSREAALKVAGIEIGLRLEAGDGDMVRLAPQWLERMCDELLKNAGKALRETNNPRITLATRRKGLRVEIECADNGPGLTPELQTQVGWGRLPSKWGTGSGLSLIQSVVMQYDGLLSALEPSSQSNGAVFRISLPAYRRPGDAS